MPMELVRNLPYDHPYRWDGTLFGGPKLWRPTEISTALWLDAEDASTITLNGSTVSQWNDKSGNSKHVAQTTATNQPTYTSSAINGKPAMVFDGAGDCLVGTSNFGIFGNPLFAVAGVFSVQLPSQQVFLSWGSTGQGGGFHYMGAGSGNDVWTGFAGGTQIGTASLTSPATPHVSVISRRATDTANWLVSQNGNNLAVTQGNATAVLLSDGPLNIGRWVAGSNFAAMTAGEIVLLSGLLSAPDRQRLEGYLAWKWGLEANLPANHPYKLLPPTV